MTGRPWPWWAPLLAPCGTETAYNRHRRRRERVDLACVAAATAARTARDRARKERGNR